jgi:hypothetical protein
LPLSGSLPAGALSPCLTLAATFRLHCFRRPARRGWRPGLEPGSTILPAMRPRFYGHFILGVARQFRTRKRSTRGDSGNAARSPALWGLPLAWLPRVLRLAYFLAMWLARACLSARRSLVPSLRAPSPCLTLPATMRPHCFCAFGRAARASCRGGIGWRVADSLPPLPLSVLGGRSLLPPGWSRCCAQCLCLWDPPARLFASASAP